MCREHALKEIGIRHSCPLRCERNIQPTQLLPVKVMCTSREETLNGGATICR